MLNRVLIKAYPQSNCTGNFKNSSSESLMLECLIKIYPQNNWPENFENFQQPFSDVEQSFN